MTLSLMLVANSFSYTIYVELVLLGFDVQTQAVLVKHAFVFMVEITWMRDWSRSSNCFHGGKAIHSCEIWT